MEYLELVVVSVAEELAADDVFVPVRQEAKEWKGCKERNWGLCCFTAA